MTVVSDEAGIIGSVDVASWRPGPCSARIASGQDVDGQRIVVCSWRGQETAAEEVCRVAREIGLEAIFSTPDEHDRQMARSQAVVFLLHERCGWRS